MKLEEILHFFIIPVIIGIVGGTSAYIFRYLIKIFSNLYNSVNILHSGYFSIFFMPIFFYVSHITIKKFLKEHSNITIDEIAKKISLMVGKFSFIKGFLALILTSLSIGFGVPVGRESPIAKLGGLLTEVFIKLAKIPRINIPIYLSAGVSSALSATFNAPVAGIFFGLEIILGKVNTYIVIPLIISSSVATLIAREFIGYYTAFYVPHLNYSEKYLFLVPIGAVFFSFISLLINASLRLSRKLKVKYRHNWEKIVLFSGLLVGLIIAFLPETKGVGYDYITHLFVNSYSISYTFAVMTGKLIGVILSLGSGLFGGLMSPSIFIGAFGGYWFGSLFSDIDPRVFALIGTASILAGTSKAPMRSSIIIIELTHSYQLLIPILFSAAITSFILSKFEPGSYFKRTLIQKGIDIDNEFLVEFINNCDFSKFIENIPPVKINDNLSQIFKKFSKRKTNYIAVVDEENKLVGVISSRDIRKRWLLRKKELKAKDIMSEKPFHITENICSEDIFKALSILDVSHVPYTDSEGKYKGMLNLHKFLKELSLAKMPYRIA